MSLSKAVLVVVFVAGCASPDPAPSFPPCVVPATGLPDDIFCTGLYVDHDVTQLAPDALPYTPGVTLWSDGAQKQRYLYLPAGAQIDTHDLDAWNFPVDTRAWKAFEVDGRLVETRLMWKRTATDWAAGTYIWNDDGTAATLNTATKGTLLDNGYEIPTMKDCDKCHHGGVDNLLGVEAVGLGLSSAQGETLSALVEHSRLSHPPRHTTIQLPEDATGKAGAGLGYLHVNCGVCHSARGIGAETDLLLRLRAEEFWPDGADGDVVAVSPATTDAVRVAVSKPPTTASIAQHFPGHARITPGDHASSLVWELTHLRGNYQMPPLVTHVVDEDGTAQLAAWIDAMR